MEKTKDKRRRRGLDFQNWIARWLDERGWTVHNQRLRSARIFNKKTGQFMFVSLSQDIFGCVDLVAKKKGYTNLWIQATLDYHKTRKANELGAVPWMAASDSPEIWIKRKDGHVDILRVSSDMWPTIGFELVGQIVRGKYAKQPEVEFRQTYGEKIEKGGKQVESK